MEKEFIPYEQALDLKELGFDEPCIAFYNGRFLDYKIQGGDICSPYLSTENRGECPNAPTFSQAFRWFREKYQLHSTITSISQESWQWHIQKPGQQLGELYDEDFYTYGEAELACLTKLIEIIKK